MLPDTNSQDKVGETTIYVAGSSYGDGKPVLSVKKYAPEAKINIGINPPYVMSLAYCCCGKRGTVFLLTVNGMFVGKFYEYSTRLRTYQLVKQTVQLDDADWMFEQFETDCSGSPQLQGLDFDIYTHGKWISKRFFGIHPSRTHISVVKEFADTRDELTYTQKLSQQMGRRRDPIEQVLLVLHEWREYSRKCIERRKIDEKQNLIAKKRHPGDKIFSMISDERSDEDRYYEALDELQEIKEQLDSGKCDNTELARINSRLPAIQALLEKRDDIAERIEEMLEDAEPTEVDLGFSELSGG